MSVSDFMTPEGKWECTKCGACCNLVGHVYPELDRGDYGCIHLQRDNTCEIYLTRPELCVIPEDIKEHMPHQLAKACDTLDRRFNASTKDK